MARLTCEPTVTAGFATISGTDPADAARCCAAVHGAGGRAVLLSVARYSVDDAPPGHKVVSYNFVRLNSTRGVLRAAARPGWLLAQGGLAGRRGGISTERAPGAHSAAPRDA
jgi:hypothetical protein